MPRVPHEKFYINAYKKYGPSAQGVCWIDQKRQEIRFDQILKALPNSLENYTIVDAGCGFGDLYRYMCQQGKRPKRYIGIDTIKPFVKIAKQNTQQTILHVDILTHPQLPQGDFYICSGALNTLTPFETHLFLQRCFENAKRGVVFNFLWGDKESEVYNYITNKQINSLIQTCNATVFYDASEYLPNDRTIGICAQSLES